MEAITYYYYCISIKNIVELIIFKLFYFSLSIVPLIVILLIIDRTVIFQTRKILLLISVNKFLTFYFS